MHIQLEIHGRLVKTGRLTNHTTQKKKIIIITEYLKIYFIWSIEFSPIFAKRNNYINVNLVLKRSLKTFNAINRYSMLKIIQHAQWPNNTYKLKNVFGYRPKVCNKNKYHFLNSLKKIKTVNLPRFQLNSCFFSQFSTSFVMQLKSDTWGRKVKL